MSNMSVGLSGLWGAQRALDVIGQNIANISTTGYARREVVFSPSTNNIGSDMAAGSGVDSETVIRVRDMFLENTVLAYSAGLERSECQSRYFLEIESLLREPGEDGIGGLLDQFFNEWQNVASRPEDQATRVSLVSTAQYLCERITDLRESLMSLRDAVHLEVCSVVNQVNEIASQIAENNLLVAQLGGENRPLSLEDTRDALMTKLAELTGAVNRTPTESQAAVMIGSWTVVSAGNFVELEPPRDIESPVTVAAGGDAIPVSFDSGKIAGLLSMAHDTIPAYLDKLDDLVVSLIRAVNTPHAEGLTSEGRYTDVVALNRPTDMDGDGDATNDVLASAGLTFVPTAGSLVINVADPTGVVTTHTIDVAPATQTLGDLISALDALDHLSVSHQ